MDVILYLRVQSVIRGDNGRQELITLDPFHSRTKYANHGRISYPLSFHHAPHGNLTPRSTPSQLFTSLPSRLFCRELLHSYTHFPLFSPSFGNFNNSVLVRINQLEFRVYHVDNASAVCVFVAEAARDDTRNGSYRLGSYFRSTAQIEARM